MGRSITRVAIDDHKFTLMAGVLRRAQRQEVETRTIANEDRAFAAVGAQAGAGGGWRGDPDVLRGYRDGEHWTLKHRA